MIAKVRYPVFIDALTVDLLNSTPKNLLRAVLRDERGLECSRLEAEVEEHQRSVTWNGLNDLPYGVYTLELQNGEEEVKVRMIKRI